MYYFHDSQDFLDLSLLQVLGLRSEPVDLYMKVGPFSPPPVSLFHWDASWISLLNYTNVFSCLFSNLYPVLLSFSYSFTVFATVNNFISSTDVVISLLRPFHVIYEFTEERWEQIPVKRRAEMAPTPAKKRQEWVCLLLRLTQFSL